MSCHLSVVQVRELLPNWKPTQLRTHCYWVPSYQTKSGHFLPTVLFLSLGCVLSFDDVSSRTFTSLQSACRHSCDMHKVLQEATERFRVRHCDLLAKTGCQCSCVEQTNLNCRTVSLTEPQRSWTSKKRQPFYNTESSHTSVSASQSYFVVWCIYTVSLDTGNLIKDISIYKLVHTDTLSIITVSSYPCNRLYFDSQAPGNKEIW